MLLLSGLGNTCDYYLCFKEVILKINKKCIEEISSSVFDHVDQYVSNRFFLSVLSNHIGVIPIYLLFLKKREGKYDVGV